MSLVKKDGKWLVNMSKEGMGGDGGIATPPAEGGEMPTEEAPAGKDSVMVEKK